MTTWVKGAENLRIGWGIRVGLRVALFQERFCENFVGPVNLCNVQGMRVLAFECLATALIVD